MNGKPVDPNEVARWREMYLRGMSFENIGKAVGRSKVTIAKYVSGRNKLSPFYQKDTKKEIVDLDASNVIKRIFGVGNDDN